MVLLEDVDQEPFVSQTVPVPSQYLSAARNWIGQHEMAAAVAKTAMTPDGL